MSLCETLRQENLKLLVLNSELEARLLQLSAEVTDTNVKLQNAQLDYLHKQKVSLSLIIIIVVIIIIIIEGNAKRFHSNQDIS